MHETIHIPRDGGTFAAYVARPSVRPAPAIVVVHEVFGVNADIRETCEEFAAQGFLAVAPDLFWRVEPGLALTDQSEAERTKAQALYEAFDLDAGVSDIAAAMAFVRTLSGATGKVGVVGYCLGGLLSLLAAARHDPDAAVAYYPGSAERHLDDLSRIAGPCLVHLAGEDEYMPAEAQRDIAAALRDRDDAQVTLYPGCGHAFSRHGGLRYDPVAAALAHARTRAFLDRNLRGWPVPMRRPIVAPQASR